MRAGIGALRLEYLWPALVLTLIFVVTAAMPIAQADFWFHVAVGGDIATTGAIPAVDEYSFTQAGDPYVSYQQFWLMDLVLYGLHELGGPVLISLLHAVTLTTTYALVMFVSWRQARDWRAAAIATLLAAVLGFFNWNIRPQTVAFLLGALLMVGITEFRTTRRKAWLTLIPLVIVIWVNSHGTFVVGLAILGLWFLDEVLAQAAAIRRGEDPPSTGVTIPALAVGLGFAATFANPGGASWLKYLGAMTNNAAVQVASEWLPPDPLEIQGASFFACLLLVVVVLLRSPLRPTFVELAALIVFSALGIRYVRGSVWFGIVLAPIFARHLAAFRRPAGHPEPSPIEHRFAAVGLAVLAGLTIVVAPPLRVALTGRDVLAPDTPIAATAFMLEHELPGPVFNSQLFGSYLIWAAQPEYPVFIDSRVELFSEEVWDDYLAISAARWDWEERLDRYEVKTLFLDPGYAENLVEAASASPRWVEAYRDDIVVIFTRT